MARYPDIGDGWQRVYKRGFRLKCCDCGLTHVIDFRDRGDGQEIRVERDERATKSARRALHKKIVIINE